MAGECRATPVPEGFACSDDDVCTESDTCVSGACEGAPVNASAEVLHEVGAFGGRNANATVSSSEQLRMVGAGLRWGVAEGWALHGNYLVSLADDDEATDWWPAYPDWVMSVAGSKQFSIGGSGQE